MTQQDFSELTGIPQSHISKYVNGRRRADRKNSLIISKKTEGEVPPEVWDTVKKTKTRKRSAA